MGRYNGTIHKLIDNASTSTSKAKWKQVLHYLEAHTVGNGKTPNPKFDSPLPPYTSPSVELELELFDQQGPKREETPLKIAMKCAPANVVAALCHLGPEAAKMADGRERLPIHWACRRSSEDPETEKVIMILAQCYPQGLIQRDDGGRTPLHWLFWYHAGTRSTKIVKYLCQTLPEEWVETLRQPKTPAKEKYRLPPIPKPDGYEIPCSAVIVPDARHGTLPLHYAVIQGASKEAIKTLIQEYPGSLAFGDRQGRTPLAWYLGAGYLQDDKKHVCGEANDPNAAPWCFAKLSTAFVQLLVSSKVARQVDYSGRTPLHWACEFFARSMHALGSSGLSVKAFQAIVDNNIQAVTMLDSDHKTPLHTLFEVLAELQENDYKRMLSNETVRDNVDLTVGGPTAFSPPKDLIELLLKSPEADGQDRYDPGRDERKASAAYTEDESAFLPIHAALRTATSPEIIQLLVKYNPTSLVHTSEELLQTPLVHAFLSPHTAPLQTSHTFDLLMAAYVTSRHGTFMDGRLALKMEDSTGKYPIHYACQNNACIETIKLFVEKFPRCALFQTSDGDLPLHSLLSQDHLFAPPEKGEIQGATLAQGMGLLTEKQIEWQKKLKEAYKEKMKVLVEPLISPQHLKIRSSNHGMTPLHVVVAFDAASYGTIYQMLSTYPDAVRYNTTVPGYEFSCLDLHELHKSESEDADEWQAIRELLFSFYPLLTSHRQKEDMLEACVKLIRDEILGLSSYHMQQLQHLKRPDLEISETLSTIQAPEIDCAYRPKRVASTPKKNLVSATSPSRPQPSFLPQSFSFSKPKEKKHIEKSIYDDDDYDGGYVVSPQNSYDDDDDDEEFDSSEEEYFSDEDSDEDSATLEPSPRASWDQGVSPKASTSSSQRHATRGKGNKKGPSSPQYIEEKKEEPMQDEPPESPKKSFTTLSEVAMRIWCFFVLYKDPKEPQDNYLRQVEAVLEDLPFEVIQKLVSYPVPHYAEEYLDQGTSTEGVPLKDVASPSSKALFHSLTYFLGEYEFSTEKDGILLHRSIGQDTILVRATRHVHRTQEYKPLESLAPGAAEEAIWNTGVDVKEDGGYMASRFSDAKKIVYFKLTRNEGAYANEVGCREALGLVPGDTAPNHIVPLLNSFTASGSSKQDRRYNLDVHDDRFKTLSLYGGETISLADYPYALVYPYCDDGDLFDYFYHHGVDSINEVADIGRQVGRALKMIHQKNVVHGSLSMRSIALLPQTEELDLLCGRFWAVSDLSGACRLEARASFMGGISHNGSAQFETGLLPPEMFVKLSASEARTYTTYWEMVEKLYSIRVDKRVVEPYVNLETGSTYVLRCHYVPEEGDTRDMSTLPKLPYQLLPAKESTDVWCFGLLLFSLCSGGRPLFPTNLKTGHLLGSEEIFRWDEKMAAARIYQHVEDPVAQDILLRLLAPYEGRAELSMETVLNHPFFNGNNDNTAVLGKLIDHRKQESAVHDRRRQKIAIEKSEDEWLQSRTTSVKCWNFDLLKKFHFSSSEIVRMVVGKEGNVPAMPCGLVLLPYKLSAKNKKAKLAPTTKKDVERAERMGVMLLGLAKACQFAALIEDAIAESNQLQWTASTLLEAVNLPAGDFDSFKDDLTKLAADQIEAFRTDPVSVVHKVAASQLANIQMAFKDAGKAYLYLVDEHSGIPLVGSSYAPFPLSITDTSTLDRFLLKVLPFMHACTIYARGLAGDVSGLVRLIFEAAYPHIPPSWAHEAMGLSHLLEENRIVKEVNVLHKTISTITQSTHGSLYDDLCFIRNTILRSDQDGEFGGICRVECAGYALWTTREGAAEIQESCSGFEFKDALDIQAALESKLKTQERQIKRLQEEIERLSFRKELNLSVPGEEVSPMPSHASPVPRAGKTTNRAAPGSLSLPQMGSSRSAVASSNKGVTPMSPRAGAMTIPSPVNETSVGAEGHDNASAVTEEGSLSVD